MLIQGVPAVCLAVGILFMPFSPRLLASKGRDEEAVRTISYLRNLPEDDFLVRAEFLEIKADVEFEKRTFDRQFPTFSANSIWRREFAQYSGLIRNKDAFKRVSLASLVMFFQQWTGIDSSTCSPRPPLTNPPRLLTDRNSNLLRPHHLPVPQPHQQHLLPPRHRSHRHHQRRHHHPRHPLHRPHRPQTPHATRLRRHVHLRSHHRQSFPSPHKTKRERERERASEREQKITTLPGHHRRHLRAQLARPRRRRLGRRRRK